MNRELLLKIAEKHGVNEEDVKREAEEAIRFAAEHPTALWAKLFGTEWVPELDEFLDKTKEIIRIKA